MQLIGSISTTSNDAFIAGVLNTGLSASLNNAYKITQIQVEYPDIVLNANANFEFALSRGNKATMPTLADDDVLWKDKRLVLQASSVGFAVTDSIIEYNPSEDIIVIEEQLYMLWDTNGQAALKTAIVRITVAPTKVTDSQRISILQSRIN